MPFTADEMREVQDALDEAYEFVSLPLELLRVRPGETAVHPLYGSSRHVPEDTTPLRGSVELKPDQKRLTKFGVTEHVDIIVTITRVELRRVGIDPRTTDRLRYHGTEYRIVKLLRDTELPVEGTTPDYLTMLVFGTTK